MYSIQCRKYLGLLTEQHFFVHVGMKQTPGEISKIIQAKLSLSERFMSNPNCIFCYSDRCKKVKRAHHWTIEPLSKFEFGGGETVMRTTEAKNKIMIEPSGLWSPVPPKLSEKVHRPRIMGPLLAHRSPICVPGIELVILVLVVSNSRQDLIYTCLYLSHSLYNCNYIIS